MIVTVHDRLREPRTSKATSVVVSDEAGYPLAVVLEASPGRVVVLAAGDPGFADAMEAYGVRRRALVVNSKLPEAPRIEV